MRCKWPDLAVLTAESPLLSEKRSQQFGTFAGVNPLHDFAAVVQTLILKNHPERTHGSELGVTGAKHNPAYASVQNRTGTQIAWLQGAI